MVKQKGGKEIWLPSRAQLEKYDEILGDCGGDEQRAVDLFQKYLIWIFFDGFFY